MVTLDIFSDPICPWCYIGMTYLEKALETAEENPFTLRWRPFMLNPDMPAEGIDRRQYLETKFGGQQGAVDAYLPVADHAQRAGLTMHLESIERTPSTVNAHRLIHWAGIEGVQTPVSMALFRAYFTEGRDIGSRDVLADIADACGLDASLILRLLDSNADRREVVEMDAMARGMGVTSAPTWVVAGQHAVPGAQPPELWSNVITELNGSGAEGARA